MRGDSIVLSPLVELGRDEWVMVLEALRRESDRADTEVLSMRLLTIRAKIRKQM